MGKVLMSLYNLNIIICRNATFHETRLSATNRQKKRLTTFCRPSYHFIYIIHILFKKKNLIRQQQSM